MQISGVSGRYVFAGAMLGMPGPPSLAGKKLSDLDTNGDGSVSQAELMAALDQGQADAGASSASDARFKDFFQKLDTDGDGKISSSEWDTFQQTAQRMGPPPGGASSVAGTDFSQVDTDGDGSISETEFKSLLSQNAPSASSADDDARAINLFQKLDTDGDGKISSSEWSAFQQTAKQGSQTSSSALDSQAMAARLQSIVSQLYKAATAGSDSQLSQNELSGWSSQSLNATSLSYAV